MDFSPERLSRYLFIIEECNANAVILINKSDKVENIDFYISEAQKVAPFVDIIPLSAISEYNIDKLEKYLSPGRTVLFTGSSGVGKSTLINLLSGSSQKVSEIREDDCEGRHTTTSRDIILRENGGVIIDIPGIREVQLGGNAKTIESIFPEITALGYTCRFKDCTHTVEHGCRVLEALKDGEISQKLYDNYIKMRKEIIFYERENSQREKEKYEKKYKDSAKSIRKMKKFGKI
jgi:ribosome biogenesis GTPase